MGLKHFVTSCVCLLKLLTMYVESCTFNHSCRCSSFQKTLYADCSNQGLHETPQFWPNVTRINLSRNKLSQFPTRQLLPNNLTFLDLSNNKIENFTNGMFCDLWKLSDLRLNGNKLRVSSDLNWTLFADLINIKHLDLSYNPELTFQILPILAYGIQNSTIDILRLDKIHCSFGLGTELRIDHVRFLKHTNLRELHLSSNKIEIVENGAMEYIPTNLKRISIADNSFSFGLYLLETYLLKNLEWMNASLQHYQHPPYEIFKNLILFSCNDRYRQTSFYEILNNTLSIPATLPNGISRDYSSFDFNYTIPIPQNLKTLYLNNSGLGYDIPKIRFSKSRLENLYMQGNVLMSWNGPVLGVNTLKRLDLSNNFCSKISNIFFQDATALIELTLNDNLIGFSVASDTDGNIFKQLKQLKHLELKNNKISHLPYAIFRNLNNLKQLRLDNNLLTNIKFNIAQMKHLQYLDLSGNQIQFLSDSAMQQLDQHANQANFTMDLSRNPLLCNCQTLAFIQWMVKKHSMNKLRFQHFRNYTCTKTSTEGEVWKFANIEQHVKELQKECSSYITLILIITLIIILFLVILSAGLVYRFRWKLRYFYYMTKSRYHGYKSVRGDDQTDFKYDVFVSYAEDDIGFIRKMVSELEGERGVRLCIHHRDFVPGYNIAENIITAINKSKKTIIILSPNFIKSSWCMYELHIAKMEEIYSRDKENVLFLVCYEAVPPERIPLSIMDVIKEKSYIEFPNDEYGNTVFWNRLSEALT